MPRTAEPWRIVAEKRPNGTERYRLVWRDTRGRRRRSDLPDATTMAQAVRQGRRKFSELIAEDAVAPRASAGRKVITLERWFERFLALKRNLDDRSLRAYRESYGRAAEYLGNHALDRYTREQVDAWITAMEAEKLAASTVSKHARHLRAIFKLAVRYGHISTCPVQAPTPPALVRAEYITLDALDRILDACPDDRWRCLFGLARLAGLRKNEMYALTWGHVDWERRLLMVRPPQQTTKKSSRDVPIVPALYDLLRRTFDAADAGSLGPADGLPKQERLYKKNPKRHVSVHVVLQRAGLADYRKPLHDLRASCERDWFDQHSTMDVCAWLGHHPAVAAKHYARPTPASIARATGQADDREAQVDALRAQNAALAAQVEQLRQALESGSAP